MFEQKKRASARMARASWGLFLRGARRHVERAREWTRAEGLEAHMRAREERERELRAEREARARARRPKRAQAPYRAPARAMSDLELKARAFGARTARSLVALAIPSALMLYPPLALFTGNPAPILLWPVVYGYLVWDGWVHRPDEEDEDEPDVLEGEVTEDVPREPHVLMHARTALSPTVAEAAIMRRIETWEARAAERRLHEVRPEGPVIDESGMLIPISLTGQWTLSALDAKIDQVRALLAVPDDVRTQVKPGGTADRAVLRIRTRMRELDLTWAPNRPGLGLDIDSGEVVFVDVTDRILVAGMSGAGKSVALRVLMAAAWALPNTVLVIIDLKVEGALWSHTARVESEPEGIVPLVQELVDEMRERETIMRRDALDKWEPTPERPRIVVVVDEGAELISETDEDCISGLRSIARRARSAEIVLWWSTQKPTVTGKGSGLDSAISAQLTSAVCLAVSSPQEARNVLGEDATGKGWHAEDLQKGGWAFVRVQGADQAPNPVRVFFMTKEDVRALPAREAWHRDATEQPEKIDIITLALRLSEGLNGVSTAQLVTHTGLADTEVHALMRKRGVLPEPNAFAIGNGEKARGYRRAVLESASYGRKG